MPDREVFKEYPESHVGNKLFLVITYINSQARTNDPNKNITTEGIIYSHEKSNIRIIDFNSKNCKPEYIEKLKEWDGVMDIRIFCGLNGIPYKQFARGIAKRQLITVEGDAIKIPKYIVKKVNNPAWTLERKKALGINIMSQPRVRY